MLSRLRVLRQACHTSRPEIMSRESQGRHVRQLYSSLDLEKYPLPPLEDTLKLYLRSLKPLVGREEYLKNVSAAEEFLCSGGLGQRLWQRLKVKADSTQASWIYSLWNKHAYLEFREPIVPNVSYYFAFRDDPSALTQCRRAAVIASNALQYRSLLLSEVLPREQVRGKPQCMAQYNWMFHSIRVPSKGEDKTYVASHPEDHPYFLVVCDDCYYQVRFNGVAGVNDLEAAFQDIASRNVRTRTKVGYLTLANRDVWAERYAELCLPTENQNFLSLMNNAAFLVCLDPSTPGDRKELSLSCWLGDGRNRFHDKALQFVVFKNGRAGFVGEHSMMDAVPTRNLCEYILTRKEEPSERGVVDVQELPFNMDSLSDSLAVSALENFAQECKNKSLEILVFEKFGKEHIKTLRISPDSFVQLAFQLAYYRTHKKFAPVYESASTRAFRYGRTEAVRCLSEESKSWILLLMEDRNAGEREKYDALIKAATYLKMYADRCTRGMGVDRLLLGLRSEVRDGEKVPRLFSNRAYSMSSHWTLSTSQVYSEFFEGYGWSYVVEDGYGIPYIIKRHSVYVTVTSPTSGKAKEFTKNIECALIEMETLLRMCSYSLSPKL